MPLAQGHRVSTLFVGVDNCRKHSNLVFQAYFKLLRVSALHSPNLLNRIPVVSKDALFI